MNIAARLQEICEPNGILASKSTEALVGDKFRFEPRGKLELKGIANEVEAFEVLFAHEAGAGPAESAGDQITVIRAKLAEIDIEQLGDADREALLSAMSKLLKQ